MLSKLSIHIGHRALPVPIWVCHHGPHFHPAQRAGRCNICSKPNWSIKNVYRKKNQNTRSQLRSQWQRKGIWICFTFPACRSACLHVALHVQSWYHYEHRYHNNRKMQLCSPKKMSSRWKLTKYLTEKFTSHPPKNQKERTFIPVILLISDIKYENTHLPLPSKNSPFSLHLYHLSKRLSWSMESWKNDSHHVHQQRIQWGFFGLLKNAPKTVEVRILSRCFDVTHFLQMGYIYRRLSESYEKTKIVSASMPRMYHWALPSKQFLSRGTLGVNSMPATSPISR